MGCFSGRLMSAASDQKLFCELCSAFSCSFDEFVGEKVVSLSYSSAILAPPSLFAMNFSVAVSFPSGASGKEFTSQCRRCKRHVFSLWFRKIPWRRERQPTPVFLPGESHGQRSLVGYSPWGHTETRLSN